MPKRTRKGTPQTRVLQTRIAPNAEGLDVFDAFVAGSNISESELLRTIIADWAKSVDKTTLVMKLQKARDQAQAALDLIENRIQAAVS